jgi:hypothetical protein
MHNDHPFWWKYAKPTLLHEATPEFREFCNRKGYTDDDLIVIYQLDDLAKNISPGSLPT